jgi:PBSX family phage terminase large subunit
LTPRLSPKQRRSIVEALDSAARILLWHGAVRSGKTLASVIAWLEYVRTAPPGPLLMAGKTKDTLARNILDPISEWAPGAIAFTRGANTAMLLGRLVYLVGANDAKAEGRIRGLTLAGAYVDEASLVPEGFWRMLLTRLSVPGAKLFSTTNPDAPQHWLKKDFIDRAGELSLAAWHFQLDDNPALDPDYRAALEVEFQGLWRKRFILGLWVLAEGAIYDMWDETRHVVDRLPEMVGRWWVGCDYGTTAPFAALLLGVGREPDQTERLFVCDEWRWDSAQAMRQKTDREYSNDLRAWLDAAGARVLGQPDRQITPTWVAVDPSAASFKVQLRRDRMPGVIDADNNVLAGIRTVGSLLATDRLRVHERCHGLREEAPGYVWDPDKALIGEDVPVKLDDHDLDALRYGVMAARPAWGPWLRYQPAERQVA